ncbi:hypothetical protein D3C86_1889530 [compost metagenome]
MSIWLPLWAAPCRLWSWESIIWARLDWTDSRAVSRSMPANAVKSMPAPEMRSSSSSLSSISSRDGKTRSSRDMAGSFLRWLRSARRVARASHWPMTGREPGCGLGPSWLGSPEGRLTWT